MKSYKNIVLPEIKLKYFKRPDINAPDFSRTNYICAKCLMIDIPTVGSVYDGYSDNPKYFCEDCAIDAYMKDYDFKTREAAASWRRRFFDVGYLFNELIIERYLQEKGIVFNQLSNEKWEQLSNMSRDIYNSLSKKKKSILESIPEQSTIEGELKKVFKKVKLM
jgi:hypothetical protein